MAGFSAGFPSAGFVSGFFSAGFASAGFASAAFGADGITRTRKATPVSACGWFRTASQPTVSATPSRCDRFESTGDGQYAVTMAVKVGPVSAKFNGKVTLSDVQPPASYKLAFEGQGGVAGFGKGASEVSLVPNDGGCELGYTVQAQVGGKVAQLGQRLIDGAAKSMADDFFKRFDQELQALYAPAPAAELKARLAGTLERLQVRAEAGSAGARLDLEGALAPYAPQPIERLHARFDGLDLRAFDAGLPRTALFGTIELGGKDLAGEVKIENRLAGRYDSGRLPVESLRAAVRTDLSKVELAGLKADLGAAG